MLIPGVISAQSLFGSSARLSVMFIRLWQQIKLPGFVKYYSCHSPIPVKTVGIIKSDKDQLKSHQEAVQFPNIQLLGLVLESALGQDWTSVS